MLVDGIGYWLQLITTRCPAMELLQCLRVIRPLPAELRVGYMRSFTASIEYSPKSMELQSNHWTLLLTCDISDATGILPQPAPGDIEVSDY